MQFINAKQAYPLILGMVIALVGVGLWQKFGPAPVRETTEPQAIVIPALPSSFPRPDSLPDTAQGSLRVGNRTDSPVRIVLLLRKGSQTSWNQVEPLNWDFAPKEGGSEGLLLSLPSEKVVLRKGDIIFAFAIDGSRAYWGPNVVGETDAPFWDKQHKEWSMVLQP
ncbi:hypothetical protein V2H45_20970 [Tumidithrix elongata RA019]|uniref:Uncharacterized protein n=1 Tax=Tumidithrix elongata BACA0141 TaxID=2716417 RepID=A0AAW9Q1U9_9CYAN|nr:hypothetical protein [Tumidithrix elongata RA019]